MKRPALFIAAIVAAVAVYDRTIARSSEPAPRAVSGGPTVVMLEFSSTNFLSGEHVVLETPVLTFDSPVTVIVDAWGYIRSGPSSFRLDMVPVGGQPIALDLNQEMNVGTMFVGHGGTVQPGDYVYRLIFINDSQRNLENANLRLQIFGCDSPAGCIPGDLNEDGRVNLVDFATFALNFGL